MDIVFCKNLLRKSETFVVDHLNSLPSSSKRLVGFRRIEDGMATLPPDTHILRHKNWERCLFEAKGRSAAFNRALTDLRPRVVHAHFANQGTQLAPMCERQGVPLVISCHGRDVFRTDESLLRSGLSEQLWARRRKDMGRISADFVAVSQFVAGQVAALGVPSERVHVVANPLDVASIPFRETGRDPMTVLFVGRLVPKKGIAEAIAAIAALKADFPDIGLRIIGEGPLRSELEAHAKPLGGAVTFLGYQDRATVLEEMCQATVLVVPSRRADDGDSETFGVVAAEAQATGLPVVVTPHGGLPEVVIHNQGGLVAMDESSGAVSQALRVVLSSKEAASSMGAAGRKSVQDRFDASVVGKQFDNLYESLSLRAASNAANDRGVVAR